jgi:hypothetical protein
MRELPFWSLEDKEERKPAPLQEEMMNIMRELRQAEEIFNNVTDDELTEACIYRIQSLTAYRDYLIRTARGKGREETTAETAVPI